MPTFDDIMAECRPLIDLGAALHWLRPKKKAPIDENWSSAPVHSFEDLKATYRDGCNIGIRLGEPSKTPHGYLHVIDLDIRAPEYEAEAWERLLELLPEARSLPSVISGSGGASRHIYFLSEEPLRSEKLLKSQGFEKVMDHNLGREVKKSHWEIDLFGTNKQVVLPPSTHPDTGLPYEWEREIDFPMLDLGFAPVIKTDFTAHTSFLDDDDDLENLVRQAPMDLTEEEVDRIVERLPDDWVEDRDDWVKVGAALHHQFEGGQNGFDRWCEWSRQSAKFDMKTQKAVWKSFKGNPNPVRMATLIAATTDALLQENLPAIRVEDDPLLDLLGPPGGEVDKPKVGPLIDWQSLLDRNEEGQPRGVLLNVKLIVQNDPRTHGTLAFNEFAQEIVLIRKPKIARENQNRKPIIQLDSGIWNVPDPVNGTEWTDTHDAVLRMMIEAPKTQGGYGVKIADRDLRNGVNIVANEQSYHPVRQYLDSLRWDGQSRANGLFVNYLGCDDTPYHREASQLLLLGAVARIYEPGHKFDFVPILEGFQGKRKSTFISVLGRGWFAELAGDFHNANGMVENILGSWIIEIPELQGFSRADTNVLKAWVSRTHDKVRLAYERRARTFARQSVFIGSTNDDTYLRDATGGRRFWPIKTNVEGEIDTDKLETEIDQIWAETVQLYQSMRKQIKLRYLPLFLTSPEAQAEAKLLQESRRVDTVEDTLAAMIEKWLNEPVGSDTEFDDMDPSTPAIYRNVTCVQQIWVEMMGHDLNKLSREDQNRIGTALSRVPGFVKAGQMHTKRYGKARVYARKEIAYDLSLPREL